MTYLGRLLFVRAAVLWSNRNLPSVSLTSRDISVESNAQN